MPHQGARRGGFATAVASVLPDLDVFLPIGYTPMGHTYLSQGATIVDLSWTLVGSYQGSRCRRCSFWL